MTYKQFRRRYIDANEALIMMQHSKEDAPYYGDWYLAHDCCIDCVNTAPTADVAEVKHGEWDDNIIGFCNVCSECGAIIERMAIKNKSGALNYCPNCGAKMDGRSDTND